MSPDEGKLSFLTPLESSTDSWEPNSGIQNLTSDRIKARPNLSRSTCSRSGQPSWFDPVLNSSPQKRSISTKVRPIQQSSATLPLSPPLSLYGSNASSSRSEEEDLAAEFEHISCGLAGVARETRVAYKQASLECHDRSLVQKCNKLVDKLPKKEKKRMHILQLQESNFHIHSSSTDSSSERLHAGGSSIEDPRANTVSRGMESGGIFSPAQPSTHNQTLMHDGNGGNGRRTEGTQTEYERKRGEVRNRGRMIDEEDEEEWERRITRNKKERVNSANERSSYSSLERIAPRNTMNMRREGREGGEQLRREVHYEYGLSHSLDGMRSGREKGVDVSLPDVLSLPTRIVFEPLLFSHRLEYGEIPKRRGQSPKKEKEATGREVRGEKTRMEIMREEKEKRAKGRFPPVCDIDQLRGRKKCTESTKLTLGGEGVKKTMGEEKRVVRRGRSVGVSVDRRRERNPSRTCTNKKPAFVASSQVDGVSHSLAANRQQVINLIKCRLPYVHHRVKEYLEGRALKEHDVIRGLKKYLMEESSKMEKEQVERFSEYDKMKEGEKKEELGMDIHKLDSQLTEAKYLIQQLSPLISPSISSSIVNQLRCIYSHLLKCAPLRSDE